MEAEDVPFQQTQESRFQKKEKPEYEGKKRAEGTKEAYG
jgi:hypothetical protein